MVVLVGCGRTDANDYLFFDSGFRDVPSDSIDAPDVNVCPTGQVRCGSQCVDLVSNPANCGACNHPCSTGMVCSNSVCTTMCGPGQTNCNGACVNVTMDHDNCGGCGRRCTASQL